MTFIEMVVMIVVSVGLSLGCAYILFKKLKSFAKTKNKKVQLGGAIAGFVVILGILLNSFNVWHEKFNDWRKNETVIEKERNAAIEKAIAETREKLTPQYWTIIVKKVKKESPLDDGGSGNQEGIEGYIWPPVKEETIVDGTFKLKNYKYIPGDPWPDILFEHEGYNSVPIYIEDEEKAGKVDINWEKREITVIKDITLREDNTRTKK